MWHTPRMPKRSPQPLPLHCLPSVLLAAIAALVLAPAGFAQADDASQPPPAPGSVDDGSSTDDGAQEGAGESIAEEARAAAEDLTEQPAEEEGADAGEKDWEQRVDDTMQDVNTAIGNVIFFPIPLPFDIPDEKLARDGPTAIPFFGIETEKQTIPFAVLWLVLGAIYFTVRMGFVQFRLVGHALAVVAGKYDDEDEHGSGEGEVSHFQALTAALSATVGLGNIAGVALAITIGGPGATFWMIIAGLLGMASKFTECTLGQIYRQERSDGSVMGGAMYYLSNGLKERGLAPLGKFLAIFFAILCVGGSMAGGNSFQVNQSLGAIQEIVEAATNSDLDGYRWIYGLVMTVAVGIVILGGIRRIADVASKVVPAMCAVYVLGCLTVILSASDQIVPAFGTIIDGAFDADALLGGFVGVLIVGFQRAAFSNEAGVGSAAIAHSAAKTKYPVREGIVALLEPMIDTVIVCTMTALVIVITGAYIGEVDGTDTIYRSMIDDQNGAGLTLVAFQGAIGEWFGYVLGVAVALFAFSTMISWSYYGERCWSWLFGDGYGTIYKVIFLVFTFIGSVVSGTAVLEFGDLMILGMAIPNVLGVVILSRKVREHLDAYSAAKRAGEL